MFFTVDYDLMTPGRNYTALTGALVAIGAKKMMYSKWVLQSSSSAAAIRDHLRQYMDSNDRLFVAELSEQWAGYNLLLDLNATVLGAAALAGYRR